jgi:hypothetical protein
VPDYLNLKFLSRLHVLTEQSVVVLQFDFIKNLVHCYFADERHLTAPASQLSAVKTGRTVARDVFKYYSVRLVADFKLFRRIFAAWVEVEPTHT